MPGIFGLTTSFGRPSHFRDAVREAHAYPGLSFLETAHESDECTLVSFTRTAPAPIWLPIAYDARSKIVLLLEGEIFNGSDICKRYLHEGDSVADALLAAYTSIGPRFIETLDGEFNIVVYEYDKSRLSIFSDYVGSCPMYYWQTGNEFLFGSEKKCLLAASRHERKIDAVGLLQPFVHQHNLGDRTLVQGLKRMLPSAQLTYTAGRLGISEYGSGFNSHSISNNAGELLGTWEHLLKSATAKRLENKNKLLISLSSGLDSRAIACTIDRTTRPIVARTMGHIDSFEVRYATKIAQALGFSHHIENLLDYHYSDIVRRIVWRTDGETDFRNGLSMFTHGKMRLLADDVIGGWLGDVTSGAHLRPFMLLPMARGKLIERVFQWYIQHDVSDLRQVFSKGFLAEHWPSVRTAFEESYDCFNDLTNTSAHEMWDIRNRQTRMTISSMPVDSHLFGKIRPFFDKAYLEFAASISVRWRIGQNLYKSLISRIGPEIRSIPNGNTDIRNFEMPIANLIGYGGMLSSRMTTRVVKRFPLRLRRSSMDKVSADLALHFRRDVEMKKIIEGFVDSSFFNDEIFDRKSILEMLASHYSGAADRSELIAILATYAVALEYFAYDRKISCPQEAQPILQ